MGVDKKLQDIPSVDRLLSDPLFNPLIEKYSRARVTDAIRDVLSNCRNSLKKGEDITISEKEIAREAGSLIRAENTPSLRRVINATGTAIHTNLGRAVLPQEVLEALTTVISGSSNLEYDLKKGRRGERDSHIEKLICRLTGAEAATVVNNNAAAVLLVLNTFARKKEVIVSRGELVEIGGSFRIPDIIRASGCRMVEVGTTNRTRIGDYEGALTQKSALLLKVHTSNYRIEGFTESTDLAELAGLAAEKSLLAVEDLGSGALIDLTEYGLPKEPVVSERIRMGADILTFSGDKLMGGPQAGIIVGRKDLIRRINKNPLKRALRVDKMTIAALESLLKLYLNLETLPQKLPSLLYLTRSKEALETLAGEAAALLGEFFGSDASIKVIDEISEIGSGSLPGTELPTKAVAILHKKISPFKLAGMFREAEPPIIGRIKDDRFILDVRCVERGADLLPVGIATKMARK